MEFAEYLIKNLEEEIPPLVSKIDGDDKEDIKSFLSLRLSYFILKNYRTFLNDELNIQRTQFETYDTVKLNYN